ncbi:glycosyltransferase, partial [Vibrio cholerae]
MAGKNILYVTDNLISSSVYRSQVHTLCNKHSLNNNVKLLAFCKSSDMLYHPHDAQYELIKIKRPILFTIPIISKILSFFFKDNKLIE